MHWKVGKKLPEKDLFNSFVKNCFVDRAIKRFLVTQMVDRSCYNFETLTSTRNCLVNFGYKKNEENESFRILLWNLLLSKPVFLLFQGCRTWFLLRLQLLKHDFKPLKTLCKDSTCPQGLNPLNTCIRIWKCLRLKGDQKEENKQ